MGGLWANRDLEIGFNCIDDGGTASLIRVDDSANYTCEALPCDPFDEVRV